MPQKVRFTASFSLTLALTGSLLFTPVAHSAQKGLYTKLRLGGLDTSSSPSQSGQNTVSGRSQGTGTGFSSSGAFVSSPYGTRGGAFNSGMSGFFAPRHAQSSGFVSPFSSPLGGAGKSTSVGSRHSTSLYRSFGPTDHGARTALAKARKSDGAFGDSTFGSELSSKSRNFDFDQSAKSFTGDIGKTQSLTHQQRDSLEQLGQFARRERSARSYQSSGSESSGADTADGLMHARQPELSTADVKRFIHQTSGQEDIWLHKRLDDARSVEEQARKQHIRLD